MKPTRFVFTCLVILATHSQTLVAAGYATRDLNPILQSIYLPAYTTFSESNGFNLEHSLFITNSLNLQSKGNESLVIDVENYRYEIGLRFRHNKWLAFANLPFMVNSSGELDHLIEGWHDLLGLSQGKRDKTPKHKLKLEYRRDGETVYLQDRGSRGIADTSLAVGYQPQGGAIYFFGLELPTGSASDFSGNEAIDVALWVSGETEIDQRTTGHGLFGVSFPGDDGNLEGLVKDSIWVAQVGIERQFTDKLMGIFQLDLHGPTINGSQLRAFDSSLQLQLGLGILGLVDKHRLDLFFSEDFLIGSAPDISFGARLSTDF